MRDCTTSLFYYEQKMQKKKAKKEVIIKNKNKNKKPLLIKKHLISLINKKLNGHSQRTKTLDMSQEKQHNNEHTNKILNNL